MMMDSRPTGQRRRVTVVCNGATIYPFHDQRWLSFGWRPVPDPFWLGGQE